MLSLLTAASGLLIPSPVPNVDLPSVAIVRSAVSSPLLAVRGEPSLLFPGVMIADEAAPEEEEAVAVEPTVTLAQPAAPSLFDTFGDDLSPPAPAPSRSIELPQVELPQVDAAKLSVGLSSFVDGVAKSAKQSASQLESTLSSAGPTLDKELKAAPETLERTFKENAPIIEQKLKTEVVPSLRKGLAVTLTETRRAVTDAEPTLKKTAEDLTPVLKQAGEVVAPVLERGVSTAGSALSSAALSAGSSIGAGASSALNSLATEASARLNESPVLTTEQQRQLEDAARAFSSGSESVYKTAAPIVEAGVKAAAPLIESGIKEATPYVERARDGVARAAGSALRSSLQSLAQQLDQMAPPPPQ